MNQSPIRSADGKFHSTHHEALMFRALLQKFWNVVGRAEEDDPEIRQEINQPLNGPQY